MSNPLDREDGRDEAGHVLLHRALPSARYQREHSEYMQYELETAAIPARPLSDLAQERRTAELERLSEHRAQKWGVGFSRCCQSGACQEFS